jgi:hypothetical protein
LIWLKTNSLFIFSKLSSSFQLPDTAFISNFTMTVGNKIIPGIVKEKGYASKIYEDSKKQGVSAAFFVYIFQTF